MTKGAMRVGRAAGAAVLCCMAAAAASASQTCAPEAGTTLGVARVLDGETLLLDGGLEARLIGAMAPKPDAFFPAADWPPARDAARALESLVADRAVTLRYEGRRRDRYGRALAQVYVVADGEAASDRATWIQERLVRDGHARAYALPGNTGCLRALLAAESEARKAKRGLWRREIYAVRAAGDTEVLLRLAGRFLLVAGRVENVTRTQRTTYVNFGADWRRDFTASLANAVVDGSPEGAKRVAALAGKNVRVRGWIERRNGPMIALASLDEIELLDNPGEAPQK